MTTFIKTKEILGLPPLCKYSDGESYKKLEKINYFINDKNTLLKILKSFSNFKDYSEEDIHSGKIRNLILTFKEETPNVLRIINKHITEIHQLKEVIPNFKEQDKYILISCLKKMTKFNKLNFLEMISFLNHKIIQEKIVTNCSVKEILFEIEKVKEVLKKRAESLYYRKEYGAGYKEFLKLKRNKIKCIFTYINDMMFDELQFTKDPIVASFWGAETKCCLKKGGIAEPLLKIIELSPIAGEIVGKFKGNKMSSYTWDMIECVDGKAYKTLILDNIESPTMISRKDTEDFFDRLNSFNKYKSIYLGTVRDDCSIDFDKYKIKKRQSLVPGFDDIFEKHFYTHADSEKLFIMREHEENESMELRKMNISDLHLCKYVEEYIYGKYIYDKNDKTDILKQVTLETPCYILDSTTNIYGYLLTKWKYFDNDGKETFSNSGHKKFYIEDLVIARNKKAIKEFSKAFDNLRIFLEKKNIKEVYLHTNDYSKNFKKRFKKLGIKVIEENLETTIKPIRFLK